MSHGLSPAEAAEQFRRMIGEMPSVKEVVASRNGAGIDWAEDLRQLVECAVRAVLRIGCDSRTEEDLAFKALHDSDVWRTGKKGNIAKTVVKPFLSNLVLSANGRANGPLTVLLRGETSTTVVPPPLGVKVRNYMRVVIRETQAFLHSHPSGPLADRLRQLLPMLELAYTGWDHLEPAYRARGVQTMYSCEWNLAHTRVPITPMAYNSGFWDRLTAEQQHLAQLKSPGNITEWAWATGVPDTHRTVASLGRSVFDPRARHLPVNVLKRW